MNSLRCRGDAEQGYYNINFIIKYSDGSNDYEETVTLPVLVKTASASGGGGTTPKVIVTASSTNPSQVVAGEDFTLNVTFQNTSGDATASNIKAAISSDGTFNPVSGSSTLYIDALGPKATATKSIKLHAKADAAPGSYSATFALSYDAGLKDPVSDTEVISIPVKQVPKVQVSKIQTSSSDLFVGQDLNVMASVNNTGKSTLYNVNAAFTDKSGTFADGEQYLGNIQSGASGSVDVYLSALAEGTGDITMLVTYEDETGEKFTYSDTTTAFASERTVDPVVDPSTDPTQQSGGGATLWILLAVALLAVAALVFFLNRRKKKKLQAQKKRDRLEAERLDRELQDEEARV
ncbi:MAG: CARDB domain-containing protein [Oscillospiraceae bacterium]|nr:CARDB domain-containing protein [Oscillospiraceae bacterium]